ncbi:MAG: hypothetical protein ACR2HK_08805 [Gemmatimonadales bacterium]
MNGYPPGADPTDRFDYFMIRLSQRDGEPVSMTGQVERLGTGEKRSFETGDQLLALFAAWLARRTNMESA